MTTRVRLATASARALRDVDSKAGLSQRAHPRHPAPDTQQLVVGNRTRLHDDDLPIGAYELGPELSMLKNAGQLKLSVPKKRAQHARALGQRCKIKHREVGKLKLRREGRVRVQHCARKSAGVRTGPSALA